MRQWVIAALLCGSTELRAQHPEAIVRVQVTDTAGAPIAGADVSLLHGFKLLLPAGPTDAAGFRRFRVPRGSDELQVVARRIGYQRGDRFFLADRDSLALVVRMRPTPHELSPVQVTAQQDLKQKRFHVTADDIAESSRLIENGLDVVTKMRPDMMDPPGQGILTRCGLYYIWINGQRIVFPQIDPALAIRASQLRRVAQATANQTSGRPATYTGLARVPVSVQSVLAKIHPEHIEEMNYVDCRDSQSNDMARGQNAVFVVLKPGVGYDALRGTYVLDVAERVEPLVAGDTTRASQQPFRNRLLGVFDAMSGDPVADAQVVDLSSGTFARTTRTGTISLSFLPEGSSKIEIRREGFQSLTVDVSISSRDTLPITLTLTPKPK
jgi:hypothetical protein